MLIFLGLLGVAALFAIGAVRHLLGAFALLMLLPAARRSDLETRRLLEESERLLGLSEKILKEGEQDEPAGDELTPGGERP